MAAVWRCACTNYGAIVLSIMAPDSHGKLENVLHIDFVNTLEEARRQSKDYYIGATIGPVAGRILHGAFRVGEKDYHLQLNSVSNTLHSGDNGFHTVVWEAQQPCAKTNFSSGISMRWRSRFSGQCYGKDDVYLDGRQWVPYRL